MDSISTTLITNNESATSSDEEAVAIEMEVPAYTTTESEYTSPEEEAPAYTTTESEYTSPEEEAPDYTTTESEYTNLQEEVPAYTTTESEHSPAGEIDTALATTYSDLSQGIAQKANSDILAESQLSQTTIANPNSSESSSNSSLNSILVYIQGIHSLDTQPDRRSAASSESGCGSSDSSCLPASTTDSNRETSPSLSENSDYSAFNEPNSISSSTFCLLASSPSSVRGSSQNSLTTIEESTHLPHHQPLLTDVTSNSTQHAEECLLLSSSQHDAEEQKTKTVKTCKDIGYKLFIGK